MDYKLLVWLNSLVGHSAAFDWLVVFLAHDLGYLIAAFFFGIIFFLEKSWHKRIVIWSQGVVGMIIGRGILVPFIRIFVHRVRPFVVHPNIHHIIIQDPHEYSFPSGHAAIFFPLAFILYRYYPRLGWALGIATAFMAIARVVGGIHYPLDILGGFAVGWVAAILSFKITKKFTQVSRQ